MISNYPENRQYWTDKQVKLLKENVGKLKRKELSELLNKSEVQIRAKAAYLALDTKAMFIKDDKRTMKGYVTVEEFAKELCYHPASIRYWIFKNKVKHIVRYRKYWIVKSEIERLKQLEELKIMPVKLDKYIILPDKIKLFTDKFFKLNGTIRIYSRCLYCTKVEQIDKEIHYIFGYR